MDAAKDELIEWAVKQRAWVRETLKKAESRGVVVTPEERTSLRQEERLLTELLTLYRYTESA